MATFGKIPEGLVFKPTTEEFSDPMKYFNKIRSDVEKVGLCKIIPPKNWQPPFALDVEKLKFTPRVQHLNELEALTRIKLNFLNRLAIFWEMQGSSLKVPVVEQKPLDLYELRKLVCNNGGYRIVTDTKKWDFITTELEYPPGRCENILKSNYKRIIHPYDIFESRRENNQSNEINLKMNNNGYSKNRNQKSHDSDESRNVTNKRSSNCITPSSETEGRKDKFCKELQRLKFYGAGPKMAGFNCRNYESRKRKITSEDDPLSQYICHACNKKDYDESVLICNQCEASYHLYCLKPPLVNVPNGEWHCFDCISNQIEKSIEPFGFVQSDNEYTLQQFGEMAEAFKAEYFNMPNHKISSEIIENEYWNIMATIDSEVTVEYGADLHTIDHGSAFPTKESINLGGEDVEYALSPWNLNNLPIAEGSVLNYLTDNISGIKLPWMYVGMVFSTFCWHNEDHWTYSINYLHWGDAKTWYCVPGEYAEKFESTMKSTASELFDAQPDLLQQLVTTMNPHILMEAGVPVHRIDQQPGEFVVTFPRAYHAGFNQGYNFAEAVNFAPAEWLKMGRESIEYYSFFRRYCVFSHDELVCKMAIHAEQLSLTIAAVTYEDILKMVKIEKEFRKNILEWGVRNAERVIFEQIPDESRLCAICNTTIFLSAIICKCTLAKVCLRHFKRLCKCRPEEHSLQYRYTMDELPQILQNVKCKAESFDRWVEKVKNVLVLKNTSISFKDLKDLYVEAIVKKFPTCNLLDILKNTVNVAEKCISYIEELKIIPNKLTLAELKSISYEIRCLCPLKESSVLNQHIFKAEKFKYDATILLSQKFDENNVIELENCINFGSSVTIELNIMTQLKIRLENVRWFSKINKLINDNEEKVSLQVLERWIKFGLSLQQNGVISKDIQRLMNFQMISEKWEQGVKNCFQSTSIKSCLLQMQSLLVDSKNIPVDLPSLCILQDTFKMVTNWHTILTVVTSIFAKSKINFSTLQMLVKYGQNLPLKFEEIKPLENDYNEACKWKKCATELFTNDAIFIDELMSLICPRNYVSPTSTVIDQEITDIRPIDIANAYRKAEQQELWMMKRRQTMNARKVLKRLYTSRFCLCNRSTFGQMVQCCLCKNLFHVACITAYCELRFLCSSCRRTKRPKLLSIQLLVEDLEKINVRLDEGQALICLMNRVVNWKKKVEAEPNLNEYTLVDLLLEGDLLEVSDVKEDVMKLWEMLQKLRPQERTLYDFNRKIIACIDLTTESNNDETVVDETARAKKTQVNIELVETNPNVIVSPNIITYVTEQEKCMFKPCLNPSDEYVNWVQCEGRCSRWFHVVCVGLTIQDLHSDKEYVCTKCTSNQYQNLKQ